MKNLTTKNAKPGLTITNKSHPDWGIWILDSDSYGWTIKGKGGSKMLSENEFHFWAIV